MKKKKKGKGSGKGGAKGQSGVKKSACPSFGTGHSPDTDECQSCATTFADEFAQCKALTAKVGGAAPEAKPASPKKKVTPKKKAKGRAKKEPVPEGTIKKALALAAKAIKASEGKALSGAQMDEIVKEVGYPGGRGPFRLLLRERGLHPDKGKRRTKGTKVDSKAIAKYLKG